VVSRLPWEGLASRFRRWRLGLAVGVAVVVAVVLVNALPGGDRARSGEDHGSGDENTAAQTAASRHSPRRARDRKGSGRGGSASPAPVLPGGGGDEGEQEWSVYVVSGDGGRPRLAVPTPSEVPVTPAWSSATNQIAFARPGCEDCDAAIWTATGDDFGRSKLPVRLGNLTDPTWSPSGRELAVVRVGGGLYVVSAQDGSSRPLFARAVVEDPAWSPRGDVIAFARRQGAAGWDLYAIGPGGRRLRRLTRSPSQELSPAWSPDGRRIAFQRQERSGAWSVYVMRADGSGMHRLIVGTSIDSAEQPAWSPDGKSMAFVDVTLGGSRVEIVRLRTARAPRAVTGPSLEAADPVWSPSGRRIVFSAKRAAG
jgi:Tol biopolymer transport system component